MRSLLLALLIVPMFLVGCGKSSGERADASQQQDRLNQINLIALKKYGAVFISRPGIPAIMIARINVNAIKSMATPDKRELRLLAVEFVTLADRVLEIASDLDDQSGGSPSLSAARYNAAAVIGAVETSLKIQRLKSKSKSRRRSA